MSLETIEPVIRLRQKYQGQWKTYYLQPDGLFHDVRALGNITRDEAYRMTKIRPCCYKLS